MNMRCSKQLSVLVLKNAGYTGNNSEFLKIEDPAPTPIAVGMCNETLKTTNLCNVTE